MDYAAARRRMVENQLRPDRVTDPLVIAAMAEVPREKFVPPALRGIAYVDEDLPLGHGRHLMEPRVLALLLQAAEIGPEDVALDVGCATGYAAAVMAHIANTVLALESEKELAARAAETLAELDLANVVVIEGPLREGYRRGGPYDVILLDGAIAELPAAIAEQLAEGGRLVAVVRAGEGLGKGTLFLHTHGRLSRREVFDAAIPPLPGFEREPVFTF